MEYTLDLLRDYSERVPYNNPEIPIYAQKANIYKFSNFTAPGHWHDDLEFTYILEGHMTYNVNGNVFLLGEGEGIFVNSKQFHSNYSADGTNCTYYCVLIHPILLSTNHYIEEKYLLPLISNQEFSYAILNKAIFWQGEIIKNIQKICELYAFEKNAFELSAHSIFLEKFSLLFNNMPKPLSKPSKPKLWLSVLQNMIGFIQKNYAEKISLSHIALSGNICVSKCCSIFKKYLHQTPIEYLSNYRLNKSIALFKDASLSISEIAFTCGFSGASYYSETFRKYFGCTPSEYRKSIIAE